MILFPLCIETGTEDYFNAAWGYPSGQYNALYHGVTLANPMAADNTPYSGKWTTYRFHIEDPIAFKKSIKVTIEHGHVNVQANYYLNEPRLIYDRDNFHWDSEMLLRLIEFYGHNGTKHPGLLWKKTEEKMMQALWLYCKQKPSYSIYTSVPAADYKISNTWYIDQSKNHHSQSFTTLWHFAKLAKDDKSFRDSIYDDGRKAVNHYYDWNEYAKQYFTERAKKGMFIEMMAIGYNTVLLKGIFNMYDFAEDPKLKRKAGLFLDLYFTYWGEEQLDGVSGGGKARIYNDIIPKAFEYGYYFFGLGDRPNKISCTILSAITTTYRPPLVIVDIACEVKGRGIYEVIQRPLGLAVKGYHEPPKYQMRTDSGGIVRYSFCTPDFIIGTAMSEARTFADWAMISSQNRSHGVIFAGKHRASILPQCVKLEGRVAYNTQWAVQRKGTLICQKLATSKGAGSMEVWFARNGLSVPMEENDWVFSESDGAYAAVHVVYGASRWVNSTNKISGKWLYCEDEYTPIILEVAQKSEYKSFKEFRKRVISQPIIFKHDVLYYTGIYGDIFTFYTDYSHVPKINGVSVNYAPAKAFDSPFLQSDWNSCIIYIQKDARKMALNFN